MRLAGSRALLTGASGGIGHAIARELAARGVQLVLTGRRAEPLAALAAELGARAVPCDLADPAALDDLLVAAGAVDLLVANAALPASGRIESLTEADVDAALAVNLRAPIVLARALSAGMAERRRGHLVFVSSLAGKAASAGGALYSATKFGLRGFALGVREDLRPHGVSASVVSPGFVDAAGMFHDSGAVLPAGVGTKSPDDVARAVVRAVERDRADLDVAPLALRLGTAVAGVAPQAAAAVQRRLGSDGIAEAIAAGQRAAGRR